MPLGVFTRTFSATNFKAVRHNQRDVASHAWATGYFFLLSFPLMKIGVKQWRVSQKQATRATVKDESRSNNTGVYSKLPVNCSSSSNKPPKQQYQEFGQCTILTGYVSSGEFTLTSTVEMRTTQHLSTKVAIDIRLKIQVIQFSSFVFHQSSKEIRSKRSKFYGTSYGFFKFFERRKFHLASGPFVSVSKRITIHLGIVYLYHDGYWQLRQDITV